MTQPSLERASAVVLQLLSCDGDTGKPVFFTSNLRGQIYFLAVRTLPEGVLKH